MRTKREVVGTLAVILILAAIVCFGLIKDFDAKGYVQAILDQTFQGSVVEAAEITKSMTEEELYAQYEEGIENFVTNYIVNGIEIDEETEREYTSLVREIFKSMRYNISGSRKINRKEYDVSVTYQPSDVYLEFVKNLDKVAVQLKEKTEKGEYSGTEEEIHQQMQEDVLSQSYTCLEEAYQRMQYGDAETILIKVKADSKNVFSLEEDDISLLIAKILRLDEIQD